MTDFLEMLKQRAEDAMRRLQESQAHLQAAQAKHQQVSQEFSSLQTLISLETARAAREAAESAIRNVTSAVRLFPNGQVAVVPVPANATAINIAPTKEGPEVNKTEIIREVLRKHTNGITPAQVWFQVKDQIARPYVYAVLKRMKDKDEVKEKKGKYYLQVSASREEQVTT